MTLRNGYRTGTVLLVSKAISSLLEEGILEAVGSGEKSDPYYYAIDTMENNLVN